jgi:RloB-like protein
VARKRNETKRGGKASSYRESDIARRAANRDEAVRVLVASNGTSTEVSYFKGLRSAYRRSNIKVIGKRGAPERLLKHAKHLQAIDEFDEVWCVFDVDEFDLSALVSDAKAADVRIAMSNPCFEVWLLLHHDDRRAPFQSAKEAERALKGLLPHWSKSNTCFEDFQQGVLNAVERARDLDPTGEDYQRNPSSGVWQLILVVLPPELIPPSSNV